MNQFLITFAITSIALVSNLQAADKVTIEITGNDALQYNTKELKVKAGQEVTLKLKHIGVLPKAAMGHNVVILKAGEDMAAFATQAMTAVATDYIPDDEATKAKIIAATAMIGGGEETEVTFTAPGAGEYPFLCTFPGHFGIMNGKLIVE